MSTIEEGVDQSDLTQALETTRKEIDIEGQATATHHEYLTLFEALKWS